MAAVIALALVAGVAGSIQVAVMGRFGERIGSIEALVANLAFSTLLAALVLLAPLGCLAFGALLVAFAGLAGRTSERALVVAAAMVGWISAFELLPVAGGFAMLSAAGG